MPLPNILEIAKSDLYTAKSELEQKYALPQVEHLLRLRDMIYIGCEKFPQHNLYPISEGGLR